MESWPLVQLMRGTQVLPLVAFKHLRPNTPATLTLYEEIRMSKLQIHHLQPKLWLCSTQVQTYFPDLPFIFKAKQI